MRPGRELDTRIAREIFGHEVWSTSKIFHERTPKGPRHLREYSREMADAWEVAEKTKISLIPIEGGQWFAFAGTENGWKSPQEFIDSLQKGEFMDAGAAVGGSGALVICLAALKSIEKKNFLEKAEQEEASAPAESSEPHALH